MIYVKQFEYFSVIMIHVNELKAYDCYLSTYDDGIICCYFKVYTVTAIPA